MQIIEVQGAEGDIDEDNIADNIDKCFYIQSANIDADYDGVDDACDPYIDEAKPYRARYGEVGKGENEKYIYIERNVNATNFTGISSDYDPDNDGWAIVAASFNTSDAGIIKKFWIDSNKTPHVIIQTKDNLCFQFRPKSLLRVESSDTTKLMREERVIGDCSASG